MSGQAPWNTQVLPWTKDFPVNREHLPATSAFILGYTITFEVQTGSLWTNLVYLNHTPMCIWSIAGSKELHCWQFGVSSARCWAVSRWNETHPAFRFLPRRETVAFQKLNPSVFIAKASSGQYQPDDTTQARPLSTFWHSHLFVDDIFHYQSDFFPFSH